jgi:hypothetical protein
MAWELRPYVAMAVEQRYRKELYQMELHQIPSLPLLPNLFRGFFYREVVFVVVSSDATVFRRMQL